MWKISTFSNSTFENFLVNSTFEKCTKNSTFLVNSTFKSVIIIHNLWPAQVRNLQAGLTIPPPPLGPAVRKGLHALSTGGAVYRPLPIPSCLEAHSLPGRSSATHWCLSHSRLQRGSPRYTPDGVSASASPFTSWHKLPPPFLKVPSSHRDSPHQNLHCPISCRNERALSLSPPRLSLIQAVMLSDSSAVNSTSSSPSQFFPEASFQVLISSAIHR